MVSLVQNTPVQTLPYIGSLAARPGVTMKVEALHWGLWLEYEGTAEELLACGALTAKLLSLPKNATKFDEHGNKVSIRRSRTKGKLEVVRFTNVDRRGDLPGLEPWMIDAARRKQREIERQRKASVEPIRHPPDLWPEKQSRWLREGFGASVILAADPMVIKLEDGYRVLEADRVAYRARAQAVIDELAAMLSRIRIVRAAPEMRPLRLVVDNTREVRP